MASLRPLILSRASCHVDGVLRAEPYTLETELRLRFRRSSSRILCRWICVERLFDLEPDIL